MLGNCEILQRISGLLFQAARYQILIQSLKSNMYLIYFSTDSEVYFWIVLNGLEVTLSTLRDFRKLRIKQPKFVILLNKILFHR